MYKNIFITRRTETDRSKVYVWGDGQHNDAGVKVYDWSNQFGYAFIPDKEGEFQSIFGHNLKKTRKYFGSPLVFESDLPRELRVLSDMYLDSDDVSKDIIIGYFDLEADDEGGFPAIETTEKEITAITFFSSDDSKYVSFILDKNNEMENYESSTHSIRRYSSEGEMLGEFLTWFVSKKFDILTGWNISGNAEQTGFDIPYLYRRMVKILGKETADCLSPIGHVSWNDTRNQYQIAGISIIDYLPLYKKFTYVQRPNYRLDTIGKIEVGEGKLEFKGSISQLKKDDIKKFLEYNERDVKLVLKLDEKLRLIELIRRACHTSHIPYEDYMFSSRLIEGAIVTHLHRKKVVVPNKSEEGRLEFQKLKESGEKGIVGAFVKEPPAGLHEWIFSLDVQSLYPSLIMTLNISPESKMGKVLMWNAEKHHRKEISSYSVRLGTEAPVQLNREQFDRFIETTGYAIASNGVLYSTQKKGVIPTIIEEWFSLRKEYKKKQKDAAKAGNAAEEELYDRLQHVQKIFLNSIYGSLAMGIFRFYDLENAEAVTTSGQVVVKSTDKLVNAYFQKHGVGNNVVKYQDTDSAFIDASEIVKTETQEDQKLTKLISFAKEVEKYVNKQYGNLAKKFFFSNNNKLFIKGEKVCRTIFWDGVKKHYAINKVYDLDKDRAVQSTDDDWMVIVGFDCIKSSCPIAFATLMKTILMNISLRSEKEQTDNLVLKFDVESFPVNQVARNTSVKDMEKYHLIDPDTLTSFAKKTPIHLKAAMVYNRLLDRLGLTTQFEKIKSGEKIKWVYLKPNPYDLEFIAFKDYNDPSEIVDFIHSYADKSMMFEKEAKTKIQQFYTALGWGKLPTEVNQRAKNFFDF